MKALKTILNFLGIITAVLLSIILISVLVISPIVSAASNITKPKTLSKIVTSIDYEQLLVPDDQDAESAIEDSGIPAEAISKFMKSDAMKDIIELYSKDIDVVLGGKNQELNLTPDALKGILSENIDEITDIVFETVPETESVSKDEVKQTLLDNLDDNAQAISEFFPDVNELVSKETNKELVSTIQFVQNGTLSLILWITVAVLSLLIYGCRFMRFKGFIWLGVIYLLSGILCLIIKSNVNSMLIKELAASLPFSADIVLPTFSVIFSHFTVIGIISIILSVLFVGAFVTIKIFLSKRNAITVPAFTEELSIEADNDLNLNEDTYSQTESAEKEEEK